jgi:hypothetical protein
MTYGLRDSLIGAQQIADTSTTQRHELGTRVRAYDSSYGMGEFIYLKGVANTDIGEVVIYDLDAGTTILTVAGSRGPAAVAMSANVADQYGWYQILGAAVVKCGTVAANAPLYSTATAGSVDDAVVSGDKIDGMVSKTANGTPSAGFLVAELHYPSMNGNG